MTEARTGSAIIIWQILNVWNVLVAGHTHAHLTAGLQADHKKIKSLTTVGEGPGTK